MATHDIFRSKAVGTRIGIMRQGNLVDVVHAKDLEAGALENRYLKHMNL